MLVPVISLLLIQLKLIACELTAWEYLLGADMFQSAVLDSQDRFSIRWLVDRETDTIDFVVLCNCTGWVGLSISSAPLGTLGAFGDIILVGYNDLTGEGYIEVSLTRT